MKFEDIEHIEDNCEVSTYAKMGIAVERGSGTRIWTSEGREYLDLYGGHAVCATGHSHPHVVRAITEQANRLMFYSNLVYSDVRARAAEKLVSIAPDSLSRAFFCNSGTEANENAMRTARLATGRAKVVSFDGGFHGRTADSISATFLGRYRQIGEPNVPLHLMAAFGDIESVRRVADRDTAAIIVEPIQSMAGVREAPPEFFISLREMCNELGIILIFDEVQTGVGRTGNWFFSGSDNAGGVCPDVITLAKSLGSGVPVGACLMSESLASEIRTNDLGTTFGGGMLAMAAVSATIEAIEQENMLENALAAEKHLRSYLEGARSVISIRGKGCLLGIEFGTECAPIHQKLIERAIITGTSSDPNVMRLLPPLCVSTDELDKLIEVLAE
ncbi:MAG: aspartate aminotransferase family protein [Acidobacteria bacterium]|nr:aspartate aminotransferase family protein [Acidobacteriota bacterium]